MRFFIDTGASKNYIRPHKNLKGVCSVNSSFSTHSIHGTTIKCLISLFGKTATFFLLPDLSTFDGIVGLDLLTQSGVSLCLSSGQLKCGTETEQIEFHRCADVNFTNVDCADVPDAVKDAFLKMLKSKQRPSRIRKKHFPITHQNH